MNDSILGGSASLFQLGEWLRIGGPVIGILLGLSILALAVILLKFWQFAWSRLPAQAFIDRALEHWRAGRAQEALATLAGVRNPAAEVLTVAMQGHNDPRVPEVTVREEVLRLATRQLQALRSQLKLLEVIGALSPLLGLLGTVLGMIKVFQQLAVAGSQVDPSALSGGIWEALLTTAAGLIVAIPCVAMLHLLEGVIERFRARLEDAVTRVFTTAPGGPRIVPEKQPVEEGPLTRAVADAH